MSAPENSSAEEVKAALMRLTPELVWNNYSPPGIGYQTHKFSIIEAINTAAAMLTPNGEDERIVTGIDGATVIQALPQFTVDKQLDCGRRLDVTGRSAPLLVTLARKSTLIYLGTLSERKVFMSDSANDVLTLKVTNGADTALVYINPLIPDL